MKNFKHLFEKDHDFIELITGSSTTFVVRVSGIFLNYLFIFLVSRFYGAEVLGIYALSITILYVFTITGKMGMDLALMKHISVFSLKGQWEQIKNVSRKAANIVLPFSIAISLLIILFSKQIAVSIFHKEYLWKYFRIAALGIVPNIFLLIYSEKLRGLKEILQYSLLSYLLVPFLSFLTLSVSIIIIHNDVVPVITYVFSTFVIFFLSCYLWRRSLHHRSSGGTGSSELGKFPHPKYRELLGLALPIMLTNSLVLLMGWTDTVMLGMFRTTFEVGIYRIPFRLAAITGTTLLAVKSILGPKVLEFWGKKDMKSMAKVVRQSTLIIVWLSIPVLMIYWIFPGPILGIFGRDFKTASSALAFLSIGQLINALVGPVGMILIMTEKQVVLQNIVFLGAVTNIILNYFLIPVYGINGASIASMISMIIVNLIPFFYIKKRYGFYTLSKKTFLPIRILNK